MYGARLGKVVVLLLCGGDKKSQSKDIEDAKAYLQDYKKRRKESAKHFDAGKAEARDHASGDGEPGGEIPDGHASNGDLMLHTEPDDRNQKRDRKHHQSHQKGADQSPLAYRLFDHKARYRENRHVSAIRLPMCTLRSIVRVGPSTRQPFQTDLFPSLFTG